MGFQAPTRIQAQAIPVAMSGQHMYALIYHKSLIKLFFLKEKGNNVCTTNFRLVKAATGTGKTLAYLAPIVHLLQMREPRVDRTHGTFGN